MRFACSLTCNGQDMYQLSPLRISSSQGIEYALTVLELNGTLDAIYRKYMPVTPCKSEAALEIEGFESTGTSAEGSSSRRRLLDVEPTLGKLDVELHDTSPSSRRRLKSKSSGAKSSGGDSSNQTQMDLFDFVGIFIIWGVVTSVVLIHTAYLQLVSRFPFFALPGMRVKPKASPLGNISADNEGAMLREMLRQMQFLQGEVRAINDANLAQAASKPGLRRGPSSVTQRASAASARRLFGGRKSKKGKEKEGSSTTATGVAIIAPSEETPVVTDIMD